MSRNSWSQLQYTIDYRLHQKQASGGFQTPEKQNALSQQRVIPLDLAIMVADGNVAVELLVVFWE